jgi:hypothetical protein
MPAGGRLVCAADVTGHAAATMTNNSIRIATDETHESARRIAISFWATVDDEASSYYGEGGPARDLIPD